MKLERTRSISSQVILGMVAIVFGVSLLLDNFDIWNFHNVVFFWPALLIVVGILKINDSRSENSLMVGGVMIAIGALMILHRLGIIYLSWRTLWPLVLIAVGTTVVARAVMAGRAGSAAPGVQLAKADASDSTVEINAILGGFQRRIASQDFRGGDVSAIMGGCELDLRQASIQGEAVLRVFALCGGIAIKVPTDWTVVLQGTPLIGGFDERTAPPPNGSKRLVVKGVAIMGGVDVRN